MAQVERMSYRTGFVARLEEAAHLPAITIGRPTSTRMCSRSSITTSSTLQEDLRRSERERSHSTRCRGRPQGESCDGSIRPTRLDGFGVLEPGGGSGHEPLTRLRE